MSAERPTSGAIRWSCVFCRRKFSLTMAGKGEAPAGMQRVNNPKRGKPVSRGHICRECYDKGKR